MYTFDECRDLTKFGNTSCVFRMESQASKKKIQIYGPFSLFWGASDSIFIEMTQRIQTHTRNNLCGLWNKHKLNEYIKWNRCNFGLFNLEYRLIMLDKLWMYAVHDMAACDTNRAYRSIVQTLNIELLKIQIMVNNENTHKRDMVVYETSSHAVFDHNRLGRCVQKRAWGVIFLEANNYSRLSHSIYIYIWDFRCARQGITRYNRIRLSCVGTN